MFLRVKTNNVRGDVNNLNNAILVFSILFDHPVQYLFPDPDVSLADENSGVMDRLGQSQLEHLGLQSPLHEVLSLESQDVVKLHLVLCQNTSPHQTTEQGISLKQSSGILLIQGEQLSSCRPDLGKTVLDSPNLNKLSLFCV